MCSLKLDSATQSVQNQLEELSYWISNMTAVWKADKQVCVCASILLLISIELLSGIFTVEDILPCLKKAKVFSLLYVLRKLLGARQCNGYLARSADVAYMTRRNDYIEIMPRDFTACSSSFVCKFVVLGIFTSNF